MKNPRGALKKCFKKNALVLMTICGVIIGVCLGLFLRDTKQWTDRDRMYIRYVGDIFLQMLKGLILPLIVSSLVSAISNLDLSLSGG
ncbi:unnamed protein product [Acanthoscelides obtectus]|uniref:Amino acid transporter n=1 Tax=Acanthoscelides obtectus TaxID=200917 RepID=A0A9P0MNP5_ACAOB|nr:unnamed protein product [Acanthoscelides obtectus]CAK1659343.1 Putative sodium-dependent excitatory amino acid transporter glt-4 [Acanthoscelides obtectus]